MIPSQEPLDVIILPYKDCPCGGHADAFVDMLIYRTIPYGFFHKIEIVCDITGIIYDMLPAFMAQE